MSCVRWRDFGESFIINHWVPNCTQMPLTFSWPVTAVSCQLDASIFRLMTLLHKRADQIHNRVPHLTGCHHSLSAKKHFPSHYILFWTCIFYYSLYNTITHFWQFLFIVLLFIVWNIEVYNIAEIKSEKEGRSVLISNNCTIIKIIRIFKKWFHYSKYLQSRIHLVQYFRF